MCLLLCPYVVEHLRVFGSDNTVVAVGVRALRGSSRHNAPSHRVNSPCRALPELYHLLSSFVDLPCAPLRAPFPTLTFPPCPLPLCWQAPSSSNDSLLCKSPEEFVQPPAGHRFPLLSVLDCV